MKIAKTFLAVLACTLVVSACSDADEARNDQTETAPEAIPIDEPATDKITGTVSYRERIALKPNSELNLRLEDVSLADAPARLIAEKNMIIDSQVPLPFELAFDPALIQERNSYAVRATIYNEGRMMFTTDTHYPVLTRNAGQSVDIVLVRVADSMPAKASLTDTDWLLTTVGGQTIQVPDGREAPSLRLITDGNIVRGYSGCNQFSGSWTLSEETLSIGPLAMTMMACADDNAESIFMPELEKTNRYKIEGGELILFREEDELMRFEGRNQRNTD